MIKKLFLQEINKKMIEKSPNLWTKTIWIRILFPYLIRILEMSLWDRKQILKKRRTAGLLLPRTIRTAATDDRLSRTLKRKVKGNKDLAVYYWPNNHWISWERGNRSKRWSKTWGTNEKRKLIGWQVNDGWDVTARHKIWDHMAAVVSLVLR